MWIAMAQMKMDNSTEHIAEAQVAQVDALPLSAMIFWEEW
jgi:hypothetical protein